MPFGDAESQVGASACRAINEFETRYEIHQMLTLAWTRRSLLSTLLLSKQGSEPGSSMSN